MIFICCVCVNVCCVGCGYCGGPWFLLSCGLGCVLGEADGRGSEYRLTSVCVAAGSYTLSQAAEVAMQNNSNSAT